MSDLKEEVDFYFDETGLMVFTEHYLLKRNFCCKSGCRHCPYGFVQSCHPHLPRKGAISWSGDPDQSN